MDPIRGYFYPTFHSDYQRNSVVTDTIVLIALSVFSLIAAEAVDREAPALALLLRCIPVGLSLFWIFNRARGGVSGGVVVGAHYSPQPTVVIHSAPPPPPRRRYFNPFNWFAPRPSVVRVHHQASPVQPIPYGASVQPGVRVHGTQRQPTSVRVNRRVPRAQKPVVRPAPPPPAYVWQNPPPPSAPPMNPNPGPHRGAHHHNQHASHPGNQRPIFAHGNGAAPQMNPNPGPHRGAHNHNQHASHPGNQRPIFAHGNGAPPRNGAPSMNPHLVQAIHSGNQRQIFPHGP